MTPHSLASKGLSMSQAQSISNLCYQRAREIEGKLSRINNCSKTLQLSGKTYIETPAIPLSDNTIRLLLEKASLHAAQAFLMENIKAKDLLIQKAKSIPWIAPPAPVSPKRIVPEEGELLSDVDEDWGLEQLPVKEYNELLEVNTVAAHIGQFIHNGGTLDRLRKELPTIKTLEWIDVEVGKKTPMRVNIHHTSEYLLNLHEELAGIHREAESRVNYFKAKIKNMVTLENQNRANFNAEVHRRVHAENQKLMNEYNLQYQSWQDMYRKNASIHESTILGEVKLISALRIDVDPRFQPVIDMFLKKLEAKEE